LDIEPESDSRRGPGSQVQSPTTIPTTVLYGRVLDQDGAPVRLADLWIATPRPPREDRPNERYFDYGDDRRVIATLHTDSAGAFRTEPIRQGEYWIGLPPRNRSQNENQPQDISTFTQTVQVAGEAGEQELTVRVFRGIYIRGYVFTPDGDAAPSAIVVLTLASGVDLLQAIPDHQGIFAAGPLIPGRYRLRAHQPGTYLPSESVDGQAGEKEIILQLVQGGEVEGFVVNLETRRPTPADVTAFERESGDENPVIDSAAGHFHLGGMKPGIYDLFAESRDGKVGLLRGLQVEQGKADRPVTIEISPGATLVLDRGGNPELDSCEIYSAGALIRSQYLPEKETVRVTVPGGPIQIQYRIGDREETVNVSALVGSEFQVKLGK
jgi:hypothetical protein